MNLSTALKDNTFLNFSVVTGCLRITKESIFTGLNNFTTNTISDRRDEEDFCFTHDEVKALLRDTELEVRFELVQKWYDGYHFGVFVRALWNGFMTNPLIVTDESFGGFYGMHGKDRG